MFIYTSVYVNIRPRLGTHLDIYIELLVSTLAGNVPTARSHFMNNFFKFLSRQDIKKTVFGNLAQKSHTYTGKGR